MKENIPNKTLHQCVRAMKEPKLNRFYHDRGFVVSIILYLVVINLKHNTPQTNENHIKTDHKMVLCNMLSNLLHSPQRVHFEDNWSRTPEMEGLEELFRTKLSLSADECMDTSSVREDATGKCCGFFVAY